MSPSANGSPVTSPHASRKSPPTRCRNIGPPPSTFWAHRQHLLPHLLAKVALSALVVPEPFRNQCLQALAARHLAGLPKILEHAHNFFAVAARTARPFLPAPMDRRARTPPAREASSHTSARSRKSPRSHQAHDCAPFSSASPDSVSSILRGIPHLLHCASWCSRTTVSSMMSHSNRQSST